MQGTRKFIHVTVEVFKIYWQIAPGLTLGVLITKVILTLQSIANAYVFAAVLDRLIVFAQKGKVSPIELLPLVLLFALINFVLTMTANVDDYLNSLLSSLDQQKLRLKQADFMQTLGMAQMEDPELTNTVTRYGEIYYSMNQHLSLTIGLIAVFVAALVSGAVMVSFQPILVLMFLSLFVFKYLNNTRFRNKIWSLTKNNTERRRNAYTSIQYIAEPTYIKELMISGGSVFLRKKFTTFVEWFYIEYVRIRTRWSFFEMLQGILDTLLFAFGVYVVMEKGINGAITVGAITLYIRSMIAFSDQMDTLSYRIGRTIESSIKIQDALELFELYKPEEDGTISLPKSQKPPTIEINDLDFTYPSGSEPVLKNLSLSIKPGEKIAIVGENGAGKTTLVKMITRIYHPQSGEILIDGTLLERVKIKTWFSKLGVLFQDYNSYNHLSAIENVGIGRVRKGSFDKEKAIDALKKADALDFIEKYPNKLDQVLSERYKGGVRPSGGQWQKIAIARFFYRKAPILILDEPTASIDAVAEAHIFDNIYKFMKGKTVIIISHRFSTVRNADRIIVLDKGNIIEDGTHEELLAHGGKYAKSFKLQAKGYS